MSLAAFCVKIRAPSTRLVDAVDTAHALPVRAKRKKLISVFEFLSAYSIAGLCLVCEVQACSDKKKI